MKAATRLDLLGPAALTWLQGLSSTYLAFGGDLVMALSHPHRTSTHFFGGEDNVRKAEVFLEELEAEGLIQRGENKTVDQLNTRALMYFGVGGVDGHNMSRCTSPVLYGFSPTGKLQEFLRTVKE